ncbi:DUF924 family protein [Pseudooctadecabacter jejudonensis]|uniref:DUF924 domain-containing protein n=1 Tax=Pseudooctadecabacter jejudonensis TaxID=1391910 RepID=A0A1Y5RA84_9RHOB|nr:DUF924 family protein [Pseudooctadecabacter jejudonensis]SLN12032.1 hypothetical protein PSJ8397_00133 [Pseudooctadecabacter jejudonensis]
MVSAEDVISFWMEEIGPKGWFAGGAALDGQIRDRFESAWQEAREGACGLWLTSPKGVLGYLILTDQLPRNMHRGTADAFATDTSARAAAKFAIERDWDLREAEPARQFFYMPLMHSENLIDQDRCVRLMSTRMHKDGGSGVRHACAHRLIIRQFGRFPFRNAALGRQTTQAEQSWMDGVGYAGALRDVDAKQAKGPA